MFAGVIARSAAILALVGATIVPTAIQGGTAEAQTHLTVKVGSGETGYAVNLFGPNEVTVAKGSTVTFASPWPEPHTVTFPGPDALPSPEAPGFDAPKNVDAAAAYDGSKYMSSGFVFPGAGFDVTFAKEGAFRFACIIHPGMEGTVKVVATGVTTSTQAALDAAATKTFGDALTAMKAEAAKIAAKQVTKVANADGSTTWRVVTVGGLVGPSDLQQFFPPSMSIQAGDTVV